MQEIINKHLQREIDREVMIRNTTKRARLSAQQKRVIARKKIEELKELKQIEDDYLLGGGL